MVLARLALYLAAYKLRTEPNINISMRPFLYEAIIQLNSALQSPAINIHLSKCIFIANNYKFNTHRGA